MDGERFVSTYGYFRVYRQRPERGPDERTQRELLENIVSQFHEVMGKAIATGDLLQCLKLMFRAEQILDTYTLEHFHLLVPFQIELQCVLWRAHRSIRRLMIQRAFTCSEEDVPKFLLA